MSQGDEFDVSVVIPSLGRQSLERAVLSAAQQSKPPREIIIVTNGDVEVSSDRKDRLSDLAAPVPVGVHSLPPFSGPSISRNLGAWQAKSSYVAFLDDDDEYAPGYLAAINGVLVRDGAELAYGATVRLDEDGSIQAEGRLDKVPRERWMERLFMHENHGFGGTNLVIDRSVFFSLGGFPVDVLSGEDRALAMSAMRSGATFAYVDDAVVVCHDANGVRAGALADKWLVNLKLTIEYWSEVSWWSRMLSTYRLMRSALHRWLRR